MERIVMGKPVRSGYRNRILTNATDHSLRQENVKLRMDGSRDSSGSRCRILLMPEYFASFTGESTTKL